MTETIAKPRNHTRQEYCSVPAGLAKRQGAKEIGHNVARERPKFRHNLARKRNEIWAQFCGRSMKTWTQICKYCVLFTSCLKTQKQKLYVQKNKIIFSIRAGRYVNRAGRQGVRAGRKTVRAGRSTLINTPSWNAVLVNECAPTRAGK